MFVKSLFFGIFILATSYACLYNGKLYLNNQEWVERGTFLYKCHVQGLFRWYVDIIACVTPSGAKIPVGGSLVERGFNYTCYMKEKGQVWIKYDPIINGTTNVRPIVGRNTTQPQPQPQQRTRCEGNREIGTRWREWQFLFECNLNANKVFVGCITDSGLFVSPNQTAVSNGLTFLCRHFPNGTATFHGAKLVKTPMIKEGIDVEKKEGVKKVISEKKVDVTTTTNLPILENTPESEISIKNTTPNVTGGPKNCLDFNNATRKIGEFWVYNHHFNLTCTSEGKLGLVNCIPANPTKPGNYSCELYFDTFKFLNPVRLVTFNDTDTNRNITLS